MGLDSIRDFVSHCLADVYDSEQQVFGLLDHMETQTRSTEVRDLIRRHREDTSRQIENVESCFELLGAEAPRRACLAMRGIREEKRGFDRENPVAAVLESYNLLVLEKVSQYLAATYRVLVAAAGALRPDDLKRLLEQNLHRDQAVAAWLQEHRTRLLVDFGTLPAAGRAQR